MEEEDELLVVLTHKSSSDGAIKRAIAEDHLLGVNQSTRVW